MGRAMRCMHSPRRSIPGRNRMLSPDHDREVRAIVREELANNLGPPLVLRLHSPEVAEHVRYIACEELAADFPSRLRRELEAALRQIAALRDDDTLPARMAGADGRRGWPPPRI